MRKTPRIIVAKLKRLKRHSVQQRDRVDDFYKVS